MIRILCYGDSNTWGYDPATQERFDEHTRWTRILAQGLGNQFEVIEEGLNGRTTVWNDPIEGHKNGHEYLIPCLESHKPLDLVILMLGTNDLKKRFSVSARDIAHGAAVLVNEVQKSRSGRDGLAPQVLLLAPPPTASFTEFTDMFEGAGEKSQNFSHEFGLIAEDLKCEYLDTANIIISSELDGVHLEKEEHYKLGNALKVKVKDLITRNK